MAKAKTATSLSTCTSCGCELGAEAKVLPFAVDDCASERGESVTREEFCPRCFVYVRAPKEPDRFRSGAFSAVKCLGKCGLEHTVCGPAKAMVVTIAEVPVVVWGPIVPCTQCGSRNMAVLPPPAVR